MSNQDFPSIILGQRRNFNGERGYMLILQSGFVRYSRKGLVSPRERRKSVNSGSNLLGHSVDFVDQRWQADRHDGQLERLSGLFLLCI